MDDSNSGAKCVTGLLRRWLFLLFLTKTILLFCSTNQNNLFLPVQTPSTKDTSSMAMSPVNEEPLIPSKVIYKIIVRERMIIYELFLN